MSNPQFFVLIAVIFCAVHSSERTARMCASFALAFAVAYMLRLGN